MKEKELQRLVMKHARSVGWNVAHFGNSVKFIRRGDSYSTIPDKDATGFPDLVMVRDGLLLFVELKSEKGRIRDEQALWLADLRKVADELRRAEGWSCVEVHLWRPEDWANGTIEEALT